MFHLKRAVGTDVIRAREEDLVHRAVTAWSTNPAIGVLGNVEADRLSIVSFTVRGPSGRYLHHNAIVAMLNDVFGIQARGGCSCAGPYGHRLLGISLDRSAEFEEQISVGCEGIKPGWVRVNFNYFISEEVFTYLVEAVDLIARDGWALLEDYRFDIATGLWKHRAGPVEPPLRLAEVHYDASGELISPRHDDRADEGALVEHLAAGPRAAGCGGRPGAGPGGRAARRAGSHLQWFDIPAASLG